MTQHHQNLTPLTPFLHAAATPCSRHHTTATPCSRHHTTVGSLLWRAGLLCTVRPPPQALVPRVAAGAPHPLTPPTREGTPLRAASCSATTRRSHHPSSVVAHHGCRSPPPCMLCGSSAMAAAYWLRATLGIAGHRGAVVLPPVGRPWGLLGKNVDFSKKKCWDILFSWKVLVKMLKKCRIQHFLWTNAGATLPKKCW
jgi:hypothetical protein